MNSSVLDKRGRGIRWPYFLTAAIVSLLTMPLTAIWFLVAGIVILAAGTIRSAVGKEARRGGGLGIVGSVGAGLLVGPAAYLLLALLVRLS